MKKLSGRACHGLACNDKYIAAIGSGITVFGRDSLEIVARFTGLQWLHGGFFVDEDILLVYTGEQKFFFLSVSQQGIAWKPDRPRFFENYGDVVACHIPGTWKFAGVFRGKKSMEEHFFLIADYESRSMDIYDIPDCRRVTTMLGWSEAHGISFASSHIAKQDGALDMAIMSADLNGNITTNYTGIVKHYVWRFSTKHAVRHDRVGLNAEYEIFELDENLRIRESASRELPVPYPESGLIPEIRNIDEEQDVMVFCRGNTVYLCSISEPFRLREYEIPGKEPVYTCGAKIIDGRLFVSCWRGLYVFDMDKDIKA